MPASANYDPTALKVFISYSGSCRAEDVKTLAEHFRSAKKLNVLIDTTKDAYGSATEGIAQADVVIIFFSEPYKNCDKCKKEATFADDRKKPILVVRMQANCQLNGWLGFVIGDRPCLDYKKSTPTSEMADELVVCLFQLFDTSNFKKYRTIGINGEVFLKNCYRELDYAPKLEAIKKICCSSPRQGGLLVLTGDEGVGKTHFMSLLFLQSDCQAFLTNQCGIGTVLWFNCEAFRDETNFEETKSAFAAELQKLTAMATKRSEDFEENLHILTEQLQAPPLFVFDNVFHFRLVSFIREQCKNLPCIVITRTECSDQMSASSHSSWNEIVTILECVHPLTKDAIFKMLGDTYGLKSSFKIEDVELQQMADSCRGLPGEAAKLARQYLNKNGVSNDDRITGTLKNRLADDSLYAAEDTTAELTFIGVQIYDNYIARPVEEANIRRGIFLLSRKTANDKGYFVIEGCGGIGKSTLVSHILRDPKNAAFFKHNCNIAIVIWLNCDRCQDGFDGRKDEERKFLVELLRLGLEAEPDRQGGFTTLGQMLQHFAEKIPMQRILFVLDDVSHYTILDFLRTECKLALCCVLTRDASRLKRQSLDPFFKMQGEVANPYSVGYWSEERALDILEAEIKGNLSQEKLVELARRSCGLPFLVSHFASEFAGCRNYEFTYKKVINEKMSDFEVERTGRGEKTAKQLFENGFKTLSDEEQALLRKHYYAFLLFEPAEKVLEECLKILWKDCEDIDDVRDICRKLERLSLIRHISSEDMDGYYVVDQILHECAMEMAVQEYLKGKPPSKGGHLLSHLRTCLLFDKESYDEENDIGSILRNLTRFGEQLEKMLQLIEVEEFQFLEMQNHSSEVAGDLTREELLRVASTCGQLYLVNYLIKVGTHPDARDGQGRTALMKAANAGHAKVVELLLSKAVEVNTIDRRSETAVTYAVDGSHVEVIEMLTAKGALLQGRDLMKAVFLGNVKVIEVLLSNGAPVNACDVDGVTALMKAVAQNRVDIAELLISKKALVDARDRSGKTALIKASELGHEEVAKLLIAKRANVEAEDNNFETALMRAADNGRDRIVELLLVKNAEFNVRDLFTRLPLMKAANAGHLKVVKLLISAKAQPNSKDVWGETALTHAADNDHVDVVEFLIANGADVNAKDRNDKTALMKAAVWGNKKIVELLISKGADVNFADADGVTALMKASYWGQEKVAGLLVTKGSQIDALDKNLETALMKAAYAGKDEVVRLLLSSGAKSDLRDKTEKTALEKAMEAGRSTVIELLKGRSNQG